MKNVKDIQGRSKNLKQGGEINNTHNINFNSSKNEVRKSPNSQSRKEKGKPKFLIDE